VYKYVLWQRTIFSSINTFNRLICCSNKRIHFRLEISYDSRLVEQSNCRWSLCTHKHMDKQCEYMFVNEVKIELEEEVISSTRCLIHWPDKIYSYHHNNLFQ
jgi:hypothetical protein